MFKKRYFKAGYDFKTGFLCKLFLSLGIMLLAAFIILIAVPSDFSDSTIPESLLSLSLICFAIAVISYFFYCQFAKLAEIVDEIEKGEGKNET